MITFYIIILLSLLFTKYLEVSFLPSFFYFRYFLLSISIFYLLKKYDFVSTVFLYVISCTILIVVIDGFIQYSFKNNIFGYKLQGNHTPDAMRYITSFFNEEKKFGSYLVRFLPLILSLFYLYNKKESIHLDKFLLIIIGIFIFYSSERTAMGLYFVICISFILINEHRLKLTLALILIFGILFSLNLKLTNKYIKFTLEQITGSFIAGPKKPKETLRFYSFEHENLAYTSIKISQKNFLFGSGVKTFFNECNRLKKETTILDTINKRGNKLLCSTHPHSTYFQLLSDIGIFGFLLGLFFLCYVILTYFKIIFRAKKITSNYLSYYFINLGLLINLFPLIPSGSIFNNWISLIIFYLFGFWLFLKNKLDIKKPQNSLA